MKRTTSLLTLVSGLLLLSAQAVALNASEARHLLVRTGFNASTTEITALASLTREQAIDQLIGNARDNPTPALPGWANQAPFPPRGMRHASEEERKAMRRERRQQGLALQGWWIEQMLSTRSPLHERMNLFWHNHFTSSLKKVKSPQLILRQHLLIREHALGSFSRLLSDISVDPAMLLYLDNATSKHTAPNENFARELLELFTLGEGPYNEADIKAAARAFTGHSLHRRDGEYRYRPRWHDTGQKTFLGVSGRLGAEDILAILLRQQATADHITDKLWQEFITVAPSEGQIAHLAHRFRRNGYAIDGLLRDILLSEAFWAPENIGTRIKSPVELLVGTLRQFNITPERTQALARATNNLGQALFNPPDVKGWRGGTAWINADRLLQRQNIITRFTSGRRGRALSHALRGLQDTPAQRQQLAALLLPIPVVDTDAPGLSGDLADYTAALLHDPAYQLN